jgi:enoyl-CoA hydratase/carnithine racemase
MSEQADATITEHDAIITVTFDRQKKLNAINTQICAAWLSPPKGPTSRQGSTC